MFSFSPKESSNSSPLTDFPPRLSSLRRQSFSPSSSPASPSASPSSSAAGESSRSRRNSARGGEWGLHGLGLELGLGVGRVDELNDSAAGVAPAAGQRKSIAELQEAEREKERPWSSLSGSTRCGSASGAGSGRGRRGGAGGASKRASRELDARTTRTSEKGKGKGKESVKDTTAGEEKAQELRAVEDDDAPSLPLLTRRRRRLSLLLGTLTLLLILWSTFNLLQLVWGFLPNSSSSRDGGSVWRAERATAATLHVIGILAQAGVVVWLRSRRWTRTRNRWALVAVAGAGMAQLAAAGMNLVLAFRARCERKEWGVDLLWAVEVAGGGGGDCAPASPALPVVGGAGPRREKGWIAATAGRAVVTLLVLMGWAWGVRAFGRALEREGRAEAAKPRSAADIAGDRLPFMPEWQRRGPSSSSGGGGTTDQLEEKAFSAIASRREGAAAGEGEGGWATWMAAKFWEGVGRAMGVQAYEEVEKRQMREEEEELPLSKQGRRSWIAGSPPPMPMGMREQDIALLPPSPTITTTYQPFKFVDQRPSTSTSKRLSFESNATDSISLRLALAAQEDEQVRLSPVQRQQRDEVVLSPSPPVSPQSMTFSFNSTSDSGTSRSDAYHPVNTNTAIASAGSSTTTTYQRSTLLRGSAEAEECEVDLDDLSSLDSFVDEAFLPPPPTPQSSSILPQQPPAWTGSSGSTRGALVYVRMSDGRLVRKLSTIGEGESIDDQRSVRGVPSLASLVGSTRGGSDFWPARSIISEDFLEEVEEGEAEGEEEARRRPRAATLGDAEEVLLDDVSEWRKSIVPGHWNGHEED